MNPVHAAAIATALLASPIAVPTTAAAADAPTCHGVRATLVGQPGKPLDGTRRRDVIVTAGSPDVNSRAGDDLICVTGGGRGFTLVRSEGGDDEVHVAGRHRGEIQYVSGGGSDIFVGGAEQDLVTLNSLDGRDRVRTGEGRDLVVLMPSTSRRPRATIDLGGSRDRLLVRTRVSSSKPYPDGLSADLRRDRVTITTSATGGSYRLGVRGLERMDVGEFSTVRLTGDGADNDLRTYQACSVTLVGHGGDDLLRADDPSGACAQPASSTAYGGDGTDTCRAAVVAECEEVLPPPRLGRTTDAAIDGVARRGRGADG